MQCLNMIISILLPQRPGFGSDPWPFAAGLPFCSLPDFPPSVSINRGEKDQTKIFKKAIPPADLSQPFFSPLPSGETHLYSFLQAIGASSCSTANHGGDYMQGQH